MKAQLTRRDLMRAISGAGLAAAFARVPDIAWDDTEEVASAEEAQLHESVLVGHWTLSYDDTPIESGVLNRDCITGLPIVVYQPDTYIEANNWTVYTEGKAENFDFGRDIRLSPLDTLMLTYHERLGSDA